MRQHALLLTPLASLLVACGAATGLDVPCSEPLVPATPVVMVVVDHGQGLTGEIGFGPPPSYGAIDVWTRIPHLLADVLPTLDAAAVPVGLTVYPSLHTLPDEMPVAEVCSTPVVDLAPAAGQGVALVAYLRQGLDANDLPVARETGPAVDPFAPSGGQPIYAALEVARTAMAGAPLDAPRFILLVTTGDPNCDLTVTAATCGVCDEPAICQAHPDRLPLLCGDQARVAALVRDFFAAGLGTLVVSIDPAYLGLTGAQRCDQLAQLGGLARSGGARPAYDVEEHTAVAAALATSVVPAGRCRLHVARPVVAPDAWDVVDLTRDAVVARDATHAAGWDWTDAAAGRLEVYDAACDAARAGDALALRAMRGGCPG